MLNLLAAVLLLAPQTKSNPEKILRNDPKRAEYKTATDKVENAGKLIATDHEEAIKILGSVIDDNFPVVERWIRVARTADKEYYAPFRFVPYELRGRAYLEKAKRLSGAAARTALLDAIADFNVSIGKKGNTASEPHRKAARAAMWDHLRKALQFGTWDRQDAALPRHARSFLTAWLEEAAAAEKWLPGEIGRVGSKVKDLKDAAPTDDGPAKAKARKIVEWIDGVKGALGGVVLLKRTLATIEPLRTDAQWVVRYKGTYTLAISVYPYAEVKRITVGGEVVSLEKKHTPVRLPMRVEIEDLEVELFNPALKRSKIVTIDREDLAKDGEYVISGTMEGEAPLDFGELP